MATRLFLQGLVAWLSVCFMLTVLWHQRMADSPTHEFAATQNVDNVPVHSQQANHGLPTPRQAKKIRDSAATMKASPVSQVATHKGSGLGGLPPLVKRAEAAAEAPVASAAKASVARTTPGRGSSRDHPSVPWLPDERLERIVDEKKVSVFMDWGRGNLAFTLANYRALESILAHHPNAEVKNAHIVLFIAARGLEALSRACSRCPCVLPLFRCGYKAWRPCPRRCIATPTR